MKKHLFLILLFTGVHWAYALHPANKSKKCETYTEADLPLTVLSDWNNLDNGLHVAVGSIDTRYVKHEIPTIDPKVKWEGTAWRGERVSAQLVLWTKDSVGDIRCRFSDFITRKGERFSARAAKARFVRYVITDEFGTGCGSRKPEDYAASLSADVLDNITCFDMQPCTTRPVWISIDVPADAKPGIYTSFMALVVNGKVNKKIKFTLKVSSRTLPPPSAWQFHLDLWQNPYSVARVAGVVPWSEAHWKALHPVMKMLADAGQKVITTTINKRPWNGQTEDAFDSMIGWVKKTDGNWAYDYTMFDRWVEFMMSLGIKKQINCYSMVPWGNIIYYYDERLQKEVSVSLKPGTDEYEQAWKPFLNDFIKHLEQKGWAHITRIAMDERNPEEMKAMLKMLNETAPAIGVSFADNHKSYMMYPNQLIDMSVAHGTLVDNEVLLDRKNKNFVTTWYVCCTDSFPNVFTMSEPAEAAFIGWYTAAAGFDGFLRWAYNSWVKEPLLDSRFIKWPAGDTYIVYPGGRSSIRFERLREGIQDAEKIRILRNELQIAASPQAKADLERLNAMLKRFNVTLRPDNLNLLMKEAKQMIDYFSF